MAEVTSGEDFLLAILNSTPVVDGTPADEFADAARARARLAAAGGRGTEAELRRVLRARRLRRGAGIQKAGRAHGQQIHANTAFRPEGHARHRSG